MSNNKKDNVVAKNLRSDANELYRKNKFYDALVNYNKSLCNAVVGSEEMASAYANRSAVYFELKLYEKAIKNIKKALEKGYPEEKKKILLERKSKSENLLQTSEKKAYESADDYFKLTYKPNPKYPSFANCLELRNNGKYGRFIVTNRDLFAGDIIAIEEFFYYNLKTQAVTGYESSKDLVNYQLCAYCFNDNSLDLDPCHGCIYTMYCSEECRNESFKEFHQYECNLMYFLTIQSEANITFRTFFKALSICNGSIEELQDLIKEINPKRELTVFDFDFSKMSDNEKKKRLIQVMYCAHKGTKKNLKQPIEFLFGLDDGTAALFENHRDFIIKFITHIHAVQSINAFEIAQDISKVGLKSICAGDCMCPGLTLLNHSCSPNIGRIVIGKKFALVVMRKIKAGEQIFDCYGQDYLRETRDIRREFLKEYGFDCDCLACDKNYSKPINLTSMTIDDSLKGRFYDYACEEVFNQDIFGQLSPAIAKKMLTKNFKIINEHFEPNTQLYADYTLLRDGIFVCLDAIAKQTDDIP